MLRIFFLLSLSLLVMSFTQKSRDELSPQGDTRMGADAATSGTDLDDKDIQAQEDRQKVPNQNQENQKKEIKTNGKDHGVPTN